MVSQQNQSRVLFSNKLQFDANQDLINSSVRIAWPSSIKPRQKLTASERALRGIDVQPRYHQYSLVPPRMVFRTGPMPYLTSSLTTSNVDDSTPKTVTSSSMNGFHTCFRPVSTTREKVDKACNFLLFSSHPYQNPIPYDHRQLDAKLKNMRTVKTPDPLNLNFKRLILSKQLATEHVPLTKTRSDNIDVFRSQKTPEPLFIPSLILPKGRYSPAYRAHDAYLDRLAHSLKNSSYI